MSHKTAKAERTKRRDESKQFSIALLSAFQARFKERAREHYDRFPNDWPPCHTCALNPSTNDDRGQDRTALNFVASLIRRSPFLCHDKMPKDKHGQWVPDPDNFELCSGWGVMMAGGDVDELIEECAREAFKTIGITWPRTPRGDVVLKRHLQELALLTAEIERKEIERGRPAGMQFVTRP